MSDTEILAGIWLFSGMKKEQVEKLSAFTFTKRYKAGDVIVEEGRTGNGLYVITAGKVEVIKALFTENPRRLAVLEKGQFFGEMALLDDWPRSATVKALEDCTCLGVDRWLFLSQLRREPELAISMLQSMARRLRDLDAKFTQQ